MVADAGRPRERTPGAGENKAADLVSSERIWAGLGAAAAEEADRHLEGAWQVLSEAMNRLGPGAPRGGWIATSHVALARAALRGVR